MTLPEIEFRIRGRPAPIGVRGKWTVVPLVGDIVDLHDGSSIKVEARQFGDYGPNSAEPGRQIIVLWCSVVMGPRR